MNLERRSSLPRTEIHHPHSNAYYTIDVHAVNDTVEVQFVGDAPSNLEDPRFLLRGGESRRVLLLMGKTYVVNATGYIECDSPSDAEVLINATSSSSYARWRT